MSSSSGQISPGFAECSRQHKIRVIAHRSESCSPTTKSCFVRLKGRRRRGRVDADCAWCVKAPHSPWPLARCAHHRRTRSPIVDQRNAADDCGQNSNPALVDPDQFLTPSAGREPGLVPGGIRPCATRRNVEIWRHSSPSWPTRRASRPTNASSFFISLHLGRCSRG